MRAPGVRGVAAVVGALTIAGCGNSARPSPGSGPLRPARNGSGENLTDRISGGALTVLDHTDFGHLDPGEAYSSTDYAVIYATQRPLFSYRPNQSQTPSPDLASAPATVSSDGRTVTSSSPPGRPLQPSREP